MTARFAGSRTLDERRRRWLATNESERPTTPPAGKPPQSPGEETVPREVNLRQFPLRKVISPKGWKIGLACLFVALAGLSILAAGASGWPDPKLMGPGWHRLMDANGGRLARLFHAGLLMAGGQLALLIWWGRSQSLRDFEGQYRIWRWAALAMLLAGWGLLGDWHWAMSDTACWLWSARFPGREVACWMFPLVLLAGIFWRKLSADMRECKTSHCLLWLAAIACLAASAFRLGIDRTGWDTPTKDLAGASLQMLACVAVFASLLVHARHVIHVCAEPPDHRPSVWARGFGVIKGLVQKLPRPRLKFPKWKRIPRNPEEKPATSNKTSAKEKSLADSKVQSDAGPSKESSAKTTTRKASGRTPAQSREPAPKASLSAAKPKTESAVTETKPTPGLPPQAGPAEVAVKQATSQPNAAPLKPPSEPAKPAESKSAPLPTKPPQSHQDEDEGDDSSEPQLRVDNPLDPSQLKGLSKKERRRLRKQHKDAQRNG